MATTNVEAPNVEKCAQKLMGYYQNNEFDKLQKSIDSFDKSVVQQAKNQTKYLAEQAVKQKDFASAITHYTSALIVEKDTPHKLHSNLSFCRYSLGRYEEALQDATKAIQIDPSWSKGWYRAGQALLGLERFEDAERIFSLALKKEKNEKSQTEIQNLIDKANRLHRKQIMTNRVSTDYSRFKTIGEEEEDENRAGVVVDDRPIIEFNENVSEEQQNAIQSMLLGKQARAIPKSEGKKRTFHFLPQNIFKRSDTPFTDIDFAVANLMQLASETHTPRRVCDVRVFSLPGNPTEITPQIEQTESAWYAELQKLLKSSFEKQNDPLVILEGSGCGVAAALTSQLLTHNQGSALVCLRHPSAAMAQLLREMIRKNVTSTEALDGKLRIVSKSVEELKYDGETDGSILEKAIQEMNSKADVVAIDPEVFEVGLLGNRLLHSIRNVKQNLLKDGGVIFPARVDVYIQLCELKTTVDSFFDWSFFDSARWFTYFEKFDFERELLAGRLRYLSSPYLISSFSFNGPLEALDQMIPLSAEQELEVVVSQSGRLSGLKLCFEIFSENDRLIGASSDELNKQDVLRVSHPGMQWLDSLDLTKGDAVKVDIRQYDTRFAFRLSEPETNPIKARTGAFPRWQLDLIQDEKLLEIWGESIKKILWTRLDRERMKESSSSQLARPVQVLAMNASQAALPLLVLRAGCEYFSRPGSVCNESGFHVHINDALRTHIHAAKALVKANTLLLSETLTLKRSVFNKREELWISIDEHKPKLNTPTKISPSELEKERVRIYTTRVSFRNREVRMLRPKNLSGSDEVEIAQTLGLPVQPGSSLSEQIPPPESDQIVPNKIDFVVTSIFDNGLLGEGILPLLNYTYKLLCKSNALFTPLKAKILVVPAEIGLRTFHYNIDVSTWRTYRCTEEYSSINLDEAYHRILSAPQVAFSFDFGKRKFEKASLSGFQEVNSDMKFEVTLEGEFNAWVFWFELDFGDDAVVTTAPKHLLSINSSNSGNSSNPSNSSNSSNPSNSGNSGNSNFYKTSAWTQACQMAEPVWVMPGDTLEASAAHDLAKIKFRLNENPQNTHTKIERPLSDPHWANMNQQYCELSQKFMEAVFSDVGTRKQALKAAVNVAIDPGRVKGMKIEAQEAGWLALSLFV